LTIAYTNYSCLYWAEIWRPVRTPHRPWRSAGRLPPKRPATGARWDGVSGARGQSGYL